MPSKKLAGLQRVQEKWFQVNCPECDAALQTLLNPGNNSVHCSVVLPCKAVFDVYAAPELFTQEDGTPEFQSFSPRRPHACSSAGSAHAPSKLLAYRMHMKLEMKRLYKENNDRQHSTRMDMMRKAAASWKDSPLNPDNAPPEDSDLGNAASAAGGDAAGAASSAAAGSSAAHAAIGAIETVKLDAVDGDEEAVQVEEKDEMGVVQRVWSWLPGLGRWR